jgi:hypothetical protein
MLTCTSVFNHLGSPSQTHVLQINCCPLLHFRQDFRTFTLFRPGNSLFFCTTQSAALGHHVTPLPKLSPMTSTQCLQFPSFGSLTFIQCLGRLPLHRTPTQHLPTKVLGQSRAFPTKMPTAHGTEHRATSLDPLPVNPTLDLAICIITAQPTVLATEWQIGEYWRCPFFNYVPHPSKFGCVLLRTVT